MTPVRKLLVPLLCAGLLAPSLPVASASALPLAKPAVAGNDGITLVRWGRGPGPLGIFGAIVAAAITDHRARHEDMEHCAADFYTSIGAPALTSTATVRSASALICADTLCAT